MVTIGSDGSWLLDCPDAETEERARRTFRLRKTTDLNGRLLSIDFRLDLAPKMPAGDDD